MSLDVQCYVHVLPFKLSTRNTQHATHSLKSHSDHAGHPDNARSGCFDQHHTSRLSAPLLTFYRLYPPRCRQLSAHVRPLPFPSAFRSAWTEYASRLGAMPDHSGSKNVESHESSSSSSSTPHSLTFRVMRLTKPLPSSANAPPFVIDPEPPSSAVVPLPANPQWQAEGARCGVGRLTVLPNTFGSIHASETFRSFISTFNRSVDTVHDVAVSVHIQTPSSRRISLTDSKENTRRATMASRAMINNIVDAELHETGVHILVCTATYHYSSSPSSSTRTLRQYFRFKVLPPVDATISVLPLFRNAHFPNLPTGVSSQLSTIDISASTIPAHYLVHVRLHNPIPVPIFSTNATFSVNPPFLVRPLHTNVAPSKTAVVRGRHVSMGTGDSRNLMFLLFSYMSDSKLLQKNQSNKLKSNGSIRNLGHVKVTWRSARGEKGEVISDVNEPMAASIVEDVSVSIYAVPNQVDVHHPFVARCAARNNTNQSIRMYLQIRRDLVGEIVPVGVSGASLGEVKANETAYCAITLIGLVRGQHNVCGVRVVNMDTNASYKAEPTTITVN